MWARSEGARHDGPRRGHLQGHGLGREQLRGTGRQAEADQGEYEVRLHRRPGGCGQVGDRSGSFVVRADGVFEDGAATTTWQVIDGSGSGELRGIRGTGKAVAASGQPGGTFTLDYDLG